MVSDSDIFIQGPTVFHSGVLLSQHIRVLKAGGNDVFDKLRDVRTCHTFWGIYMAPEDGFSFLLDDGTELRLDGNSVWLLPPWFPFIHHARDGAGWHCYVLFEWLHVPDSMVRKIFVYPQRFTHQPLVRMHTELVHMVREKISRVERALLGQAIAASTLLHWLRTLSSDDRASLVDPHAPARRLQPALDFIAVQLSHTISVEEIADQVGVSTDHVTRLFNQHIGQTPMNYVLAQRVARVGERLLASDESLDGIAAHCGFPNRRYLSRRFRQVVGMSPTQYRQLMRPR